MKDWKIPGMAIIKDGKVVFAKGYGVPESGKPEKVDENMILGIGSNSKAFTSAALCMLEQQGKLKLNER